MIFAFIFDELYKITVFIFFRMNKWDVLVFCSFDFYANIPKQVQKQKNPFYHDSLIKWIFNGSMQFIIFLILLCIYASYSFLP